jgi:hypothetical protein
MIVRINPKYFELEGFIKAIPYIFSTFGEMVHDGKNVIKTFKVNGTLINVKSFKVPIFLNKIVSKYLRKSKSERSYDYAHMLLDRGVNTPEPIAYIDISENGLFTQSYYVSIHEEMDGAVKDFYNESIKGNKSLVEAYERYTAFLHRRGISYKNYSLANIMYKKVNSGYEFYLIGLDKIKLKRINLFNNYRKIIHIKVDEKIQEFVASRYAFKRNLIEHK